MATLVIVLENIRSAHNVGSIMRTAAGLGITEIYAAGNTPYPLVAGDQRLPHVAERATRQIAKTSLGAEHVVTVTPKNDVLMLINELKGQDYQVLALENVPEANPLTEYKLGGGKAALIFGHEVEGVTSEVLKASDGILFIPMSEHKESFNVAEAAAMAMYHFKFKA